MHSQPDTTTILDTVGRDDDTLGGRIVRARSALGMSTAQVARRLGIKTETLANWENDRSEPRSNRLQILAGVLGVSLTWLLAGAGNGPRGKQRRSGAGSELLGEITQLRDDASRILQRIDALGDRVGRLGGQQPQP